LGKQVSHASEKNGSGSKDTKIINKRWKPGQNPKVAADVSSRGSAIFSYGIVARD
jgi:hypothetical protein